MRRRTKFSRKLQDGGEVDPRVKEWIKNSPNVREAMKFGVQPPLATGRVESSFDPITAGIMLGLAPATLPIKVVSRAGRLAKGALEVINPLGGMKKMSGPTISFAKPMTGGPGLRTRESSALYRFFADIAEKKVPTHHLEDISPNKFLREQGYLDKPYTKWKADEAVESSLGIDELPVEYPIPKGIRRGPVTRPDDLDMFIEAIPGVKSTKVIPEVPHPYEKKPGMGWKTLLQERNIHEGYSPVQAGRINMERIIRREMGLKNRGELSKITTDKRRWGKFVNKFLIPEAPAFMKENMRNVALSKRPIFLRDLLDLEGTRSARRFMKREFPGLSEPGLSGTDWDIDKGWFWHETAGPRDIRDTAIEALTRPASQQRKGGKLNIK